MMVKLTKSLDIVLEGDIHPTTIPAGTEIEPDTRVFEVAEQLGITDAKKSRTSKKAMTAPENKAV